MEAFHETILLNHPSGSADAIDAIIYRLLRRERRSGAKHGKCGVKHSIDA
jgi:hypothetical protein